MATSDIDVELLISELSASLAPPPRVAFETAAHAALAVANCSGCGAAYRVLAPLQRSYWEIRRPITIRRMRARIITAPASSGIYLPSALRIRAPVPAIAVVSRRCER
jgi:hypothetical protein